jgi:CIC family chloride channel protein
MKLIELLAKRDRFAATVRRQLRHLMLLILIVVGAACGLAAVMLHKAMLASYSLLVGAAESGPPGWGRVVALVLMPTLMGAILTTLVARYAPNANGGLSLVRTAYVRQPKRLAIRTWVGTFIATPLSLGSGAPLGPEGPTVVITSGVSVAIARLAALPERVVRGMIPVGTAAGIAAIFNTPITGVVFALEEVIGTASRGVLGGAIVAAVAAAVVEKTLLGGHPLLPAAPASWHRVSELFGFLVLGLAAGVTAGYMPRAVKALRWRMRRLVRPAGRYREALLGGMAGLGAGAVGLFVPSVLGFGYEPISRWLAGEGDVASAGWAFAAKLVVVTLALAAPLVGGVLAPTLFLGASFGALVGHALVLLFPNSPIDPGAYALVGMGAFFAGFLRTPLAAVLIVFELTGDYALVLPQMLAVSTSLIVARRFSEHTLLEDQLEEEGVSAAEAGTDPLAQWRVRDAMTVPPISVGAEVSVDAAWEIAVGSGHTCFPVADEAGRVAGLVERSQLLQARIEGRGAVPVSEIAIPAKVVARPDESLDQLALRLGVAEETRAPVIDSRAKKRLIGFITVSDLLRTRMRASIESAVTFE